MADCHPDRRHKARGYCAECYASCPEMVSRRRARSAKWYAEHREQARAAQRAWEQRPEVKERRRELQRVRREQSPAKGYYSRDKSLRTKYGLSNLAYDVLYRQQGGNCAICGDHADVLNVDHDHNTGMVRGLLCGRCNRGLGMFADDRARLAAASLYLAEWVTR